MVAFLKLQYKLGKIDESYLQSLVIKNKITLEQLSNITNN